VIFWSSLKSEETVLKNTSTFKKLATRLLTTTCLTVAATAVAFGGVVTEPGGGNGPGFGNTSPGTLLPAGTTEVDGVATLNHGSNEWYEFQGLPGGASLSSISFAFQNNGSSTFGVELFSDAAQGSTVVTATTSVGAGAMYTPVGTIPVDGFLVVDIQRGNEGAIPYVLTLTQSAPEPGTMAALGLGLAGLGAASLRRRLRKS
jgi:hypothetical protein